MILYVLNEICQDEDDSCCHFLEHNMTMTMTYDHENEYDDDDDDDDENDDE